ncbi:hypothetical protein HMPREF0083_00811 [Aneurinibacillus aneurinilyticus ATCC 12856]|uniref:Uncharacterized protein n=1 Tax=Aneurinibacillus aneurinilyticus ATCC 12856 TaxID=649747 RepID=U1YJT9_ANEAE|nr:hypothetical protein HMPREF0083_00811 [Aneurinibacillus aneurinilyticus ATCC 12856]
MDAPCASAEERPACLFPTAPATPKAIPTSKLSLRSQEWIQTALFQFEVL